ncbi:MAG: PTS sugar transporter subunit IIB [Proteobacteria bacterium]|nr:PTS sugar transporter subunit IIB [Pseudomonadota bacterium]
MSIVFARVDSRLFHGQIIESWVPETSTSMVIVADDSAASNPFQKKVMELSAPKGISLRVEGIDEAVADLSSERFAGERVMLIFASLHDAFEAYKKGIRFDEINIGNVGHCQGKRQVTSSICLNDEDVSDLKAIAKTGVSVDVRGVPRDKPKGLQDILEIYEASQRRES